MSLSGEELIRTHRGTTAVSILLFTESLRPSGIFPNPPLQLVLVVGEEVNATSRDLQVATYESDPLEQPSVPMNSCWIATIP